MSQIKDGADYIGPSTQQIPLLLGDGDGGGGVSFQFMYTECTVMLNSESITTTLHN